MGDEGGGGVQYCVTSRFLRVFLVSYHFVEINFYSLTYDFFHVFNYFSIEKQYLYFVRSTFYSSVCFLFFLSVHFSFELSVSATNQSYIMSFSEHFQFLSGGEGVKTSVT